MNAKATNMRIKETQGKVQQAHEALKSMDFEEFREGAADMFISHWASFEDMIPHLGKENRKFQENLLKLVKKANRAEMDAAFKAYENLKDRTIMLEWSMFSVFVLFRKYVLHQFVSDEDREKIAALFLIDMEVLRKEQRADLLWRMLEKETATAKTKEDLDRQELLDAYSEHPEWFKTYFRVLGSGDHRLIDLLGKGIDRLKRGMDVDEDPKTVGADLMKMLDDFKAERKEASHAEQS